MRFFTALSTARDRDSACTEAVAKLRTALGAAEPDLLIAFASPSLGELGAIPALVLPSSGAREFAGCSGGGVIAEGHEIEDAPGIALIAAQMPGCDIEVRALQRVELPSPDAPPAAWHALFRSPPERIRGFIVLPDPWTFPVSVLLEGLDYAFPHAPKIGGLVSGGDRAGLHRMFAGPVTLERGAIVIAFAGDVAIEAIVAQGCRPFGRAGTVTEGAGQELVTVNGRSALDFLQDQIDSLDENGIESVKRSPMFIGLATDPFALDAGDDGEYLMRNIVGLDRKKGSLAIAGRPAIGRKVRFHLRDREASESDLQRAFARADHGPPPAAALLFSCLGRGRSLFGDADHDTRAFLDRFGEIPLAGFFCNGEIGPVGPGTYLHGYTSAFALFRSASLQ